jgi:hypothetical protein
MFTVQPPLRPDGRREGEGGRLYCGAKCTYFDGPNRRCAVQGERRFGGNCSCDGKCGGGPWNGVSYLLFRETQDFVFRFAFVDTPTLDPRHCFLVAGSANARRATSPRILESGPAALQQPPQRWSPGRTTCLLPSKAAAALLSSSASRYIAIFSLVHPFLKQYSTRFLMSTCLCDCSTSFFGLKSAP